MNAKVWESLKTYGPGSCPALSVDEAQAYVRRFTAEGRENFSVASRLLPPDLRQDFAAVYSYCRWADDLADEVPQRVTPGSLGEEVDPSSRDLLRWWRDELGLCYAGRPRHPVFVALRPTVEKHDLSRRPFDDLLDAFEQDQRVKRYDSWEQLLDYCTRSANPVGRLVLMLFGHRDAERFALADATSTALQLTNFWQDVRRDILERDRIYLPRSVATAHGLELETMAQLVQLDEATRCAACVAGSGQPGGAGLRELMPAYRAALSEAVGRTWSLFEAGRALWPQVAGSLRSDLKLFTLGGEAVLRKIERQRYDTLSSRPRLGRVTKAGLLVRVTAARCWGR